MGIFDFPKQTLVITDQDSGESFTVKTVRSAQYVARHIEETEKTVFSPEALKRSFEQACKEFYGE